MFCCAPCTSSASALLHVRFSFHSLPFARNVALDDGVPFPFLSIMRCKEDVVLGGEEFLLLHIMIDV